MNITLDDIRQVVREELARQGADEDRSVDYAGLAAATGRTVSQLKRMKARGEIKAEQDNGNQVWFHLRTVRTQMKRIPRRKTTARLRDSVLQRHATAS